MKYLQTYNQLNEGLRDKMTGKSDSDIMDYLSKLSIDDWLEHAKMNDLDKKYYPPDEDIKEFLSNASTEYALILIKRYNLDQKFMPSDDDIKEYLDGVSIDKQISIVRNNNLNNKFIPSDGDIKEYLSNFSVSDRISFVEEWGLDKKFMPSDEEIKDYVKNEASSPLYYILNKGLDLNLLPRDENGWHNHYGNLVISTEHVEIPEKLNISGSLVIGQYRHGNISLPNNLKVGNLICKNLGLREIPNGLVVEGVMDCANNLITDIPQDLIVGGVLHLENNPLKPDVKKPIGVKRLER